MGKGYKGRRRKLKAHDRIDNRHNRDVAWYEKQKRKQYERARNNMKRRNTDQSE